jgi:hypothetical protein
MIKELQQDMAIDESALNRASRLVRKMPSSFSAPLRIFPQKIYRLPHTAVKTAGKTPSSGDSRMGTGFATTCRQGEIESLLPYSL